MTRKNWKLVLLWAVLAARAVPAPAEGFSPLATAPAGTVPAGINYQGRLEQNGVPVTGTRSITFRLYGLLTGGSALWDSGPLSVDVQQGLFAAVLAIPAETLFGGQKYLELAVEGVTLSPREPLQSVPYALVAKTLEGDVEISTASFNVNSASLGSLLFVSSETGRVGMGTTSPDDKLHVIGQIRIDNDTNTANKGCFRYNGGSNELEYSNDCLSFQGFAAPAAGGWTDDGTVVRLTASGDNVVVQSTLTIQGNAFSVGTSTLVVRQGNVGIGAASPQARLHVVGGVTSPGTGVDSETLGLNSVAKGEGSVVLGRDASDTSSDDSTTQPFSVVVGQGATTIPSANQSGFNVVIGAAARAPGHRNVLVGADAGKDSTNASFGNVFIGNEATSIDGWQNVIIGRFARGDNQDNVVIGESAVNAGRRGVVIGRGASGSGANNSQLVVIGEAAGAGTGGESVTIGAGAGGKDLSVVIGQGAAGVGSISGVVVVGKGAAARGSSSIVLGNGAQSNAANQFVAGSSARPIHEVFFGKGSTDTAPTPYALQGTGGSGTDVAGGALVLAGGQGTGAGAGGAVILKTAPLGPGGDALNPLEERLRVDSTGRVGVGTTSPDDELHVIGRLRLDNDTNTANKGCFRYNGGSNELEYSNDCVSFQSFAAPAAGGWTDDGTVVRPTSSGDNVVVQSTLTVQGEAFSVGGSTLAVKDGNVGIGIAAPAHGLHLAGQKTLFSSHNSAFTGIDDSAIYLKSPDPRLAFLDDAAGNLNGWQVGASQNGELQFNPGDETSVGAATVIFEQDGDAAIGALPASARLHVSSAGAAVTDVIFQVSSGTASGQELLFMRGDGGLYLSQTVDPGAPPAGTGVLYVRDDAGTPKVFFRNSGTEFDLTQGGGSGGWTQDGTVVRLTSSGDNVVVQSTLTVQGNAFSVGESTFVVREGNVGIRTEFPDHLLVIQATATVTYPLALLNPGDSKPFGLLHYNSANATAGGLRVEGRRYASVSGTALHLLGLVEPGNPNIVGLTLEAMQSDGTDFEGDILHIRNNLEAKIVVANDGRLGVGATIPQALLHVSSAGAAASDVVFQVSSGTAAGQELLAVTGDGRVGVGATEPDDRLHVAGQVRIDNDTETTNKGCFRYNGVSNELEYSNDCVSFQGFAAPAAGGWTEDGTVVRLTASGDNVVVQSTLTVQGEAFSVGGSTLVVKDGKVGIGLTDPGVATQETNARLSLRSQSGTRIQMDVISENQFNEVIMLSNGDQRWSVGANGDQNSLPNSFYIFQYRDKDDNGVGKYRVVVADDGRIGIGTSNPAAKLHVSSTGVLFDGNTGAPSASGPGHRFMWIPSSGAIRAGGVGGPEWDPASIGPYSVAFGTGSRASVSYAVVGGGLSNVASAAYATVSGGVDNFAGGLSAPTVGGGFRNRADGLQPTVSGGLDNTATGTRASIGGGENNIASGSHAVVGGGERNTASGSFFSTVPGGRSNTASGDYSFAAGRRAKASAQGAFVWADSTDADLLNTVTDQFLIRAQGGFEVRSSSLALIDPDAGTLFTVDASSAHFQVDLYDSGGNLITGGAAASGWTDDGTVVRLETDTDNVVIQSSLTVQGAAGIGANALADGTLVVRSTSTTAVNPVLALQSNDGSEILRVTQSGLFLYDSDTGAKPFYITRLGSTDESMRFSVDDVFARIITEQDETSGGSGSLEIQLDDDGTSAPVLSVETKSGKTLMHLDSNGRLAVGHNAPQAALHVSTPGGVLFDGNTGAPSVSGAGHRFMWIPSSGALRAGAVIGAEWDPANIGAFSVAFGGESRASGDYSAVGGGRGNIASGDGATVGGGGFNTASGLGATVAGGFTDFGNEATGLGAAVGGGDANSAGPGEHSTVSGGKTNRATAAFSMSPGGRNNTASGEYAFASGRQAKASARGAFVWADSQGVDLLNTVTDQFLIRAQGGFEVRSSSLALIGTANTLYTVDATSAHFRVPLFVNGTQIVPGASVCAAGIAGNSVVCSGNANDAGGLFGVVGGGETNSANGAHSTVGGGSENLVDGDFATVAGGAQNQADGDAASVAGGAGNLGTGGASAVGGGVGNIAEGVYAAVPGGAGNLAQGDLSFAAGYGSTASARGSFVWSDSRGGLLGRVTDQFLIGAQGGFEVRSSSLALIDPDGGTLFTVDASSAQFRQPFFVGASTLVVRDGKVGIGTSSPAAKLHVSSTGVLFDGSTGEPTASGAGHRFVWIPSSAAIRAGAVGGTEWDSPNIGPYSVAFGTGTKASAMYSTVGGGIANAATGDRATVAGGNTNLASADTGTVGGGARNTASGAGFSTVGGGERNLSVDLFSTVAGGQLNTASGLGGTVGGGVSNTALADYATAPGGRLNEALGAYSFAAGRRAKATAEGAFVWGDSQDADVTSGVKDKFLVRAQGGFEVRSSSLALVGTSQTLFTVDDSSAHFQTPVHVSEDVVLSNAGRLLAGLRYRRALPSASTSNLRCACGDANEAVIGGSCEDGASAAGTVYTSFPSTEATDADALGTSVTDGATMARSWSCGFNNSRIDHKCYAICLRAGN